MSVWQLRLVTFSCVIVLILASVASSFVLYQRFTTGTEFKHNQSKVWHDVLCAIEAEVVGSKDLTQEQKDKSLLFYDRLLVLADADSCPVLSN